MKVLPVLVFAVAAGTAVAATPKNPGELLAASPATDWRKPDPDRTLYMELPSGRVVIELAPDFAPQHVANIRTLVKAKWFDEGASVYRLQDNYVAQWGDATEKKPLGEAKKNVPAEFTRPIAGMPTFTKLPDRDTYADEAGYAAGFPVARDLKSGRAWLVHCYGMVGAGRANELDSGNGAELYAIIGSAPRLLDRNVTLVGRVLRGIELLSSLKRGTKPPLGFYEKPEDTTPIASVRFAADVSEDKRTNLEVLRTESATYKALVEMRRNRKDDWWKEPAGHVDVCNSSAPVRDAR
ncbi:peptidylprolyl isomerase [Usitatibacter palustris]|uniref:peptidylprolyl isomerase n=1 Tax=Usitatibacter palustris TaxID=2732487 RepID=A0A6M4HFY2_9PROT|nr:peptidylprolyl isomerase [Usitatibacter palustris]QJR16947.1 hypothetical protein DSM104440_03784 [Usitatibacter palustris]